MASLPCAWLETHPGGLVWLIVLAILVLIWGLTYGFVSVAEGIRRRSSDRPKLTPIVTPATAEGVDAVFAVVLATSAVFIFPITESVLPWFAGGTGVGVLLVGLTNARFFQLWLNPKRWQDREEIGPVPPGVEPPTDQEASRSALRRVLLFFPLKAVAVAVFGEAMAGLYVGVLLPVPFIRRRIRRVEHRLGATFYRKAGSKKPFILIDPASVYDRQVASEGGISPK